MTDSQAAFPLGEMQRSYLADRLGSGEPADTVLVFEGELDSDRFIGAWRDLVDRHEALRLVIDGDRQRILQDAPPFPVPCEPAPGGEEIAAGGEQTVARGRDPQGWPLVDVRLRRLGGGRWRVRTAFDSLVLDYGSWQILHEELTRRYDGERLPPVGLGFRDAVLSAAAPDEHERGRRADDLRYWRERVPTLPLGPRLPRAAQSLGESVAAAEGAAGWRRTPTRLEATAWAAVRAAATARRVTPSCLVSAVIVRVLGSVSGSREFSVAMPRSDRAGLGAGGQRTVGVLSSFWPLHCAPGTGAIAADAAVLQRRMAEDLAHARVSGVRIVRELLARGAGSPDSGLPLPVVLTHLPPARGSRLLGERLARVAGITAMPRVELDIRCEPEPEGTLRIDWDERIGSYPETLVGWLAETVSGWLSRLAEQPEAWDERPSLVPPLLTAGEVAAGSFVPPVAPLERWIAAVVEAERGQRVDSVGPLGRVGRFDDLGAILGLGALGRIAGRVAAELRLPGLLARDLLDAGCLGTLAERLRNNHSRPELLDRIASLHLELPGTDA